MIGVSQFRGLMANRQVVRTLVERDLRVRYAGSVLGYVWTVLDPLLMALIYFVVFTVHLQGPPRSATSPTSCYLVIGLLAWQWFAAVRHGDVAGAARRRPGSSGRPTCRASSGSCASSSPRASSSCCSLPVLAGFAIFYIIAGRDDAPLDRSCSCPSRDRAAVPAARSGSACILAPVTVLVTDMQRVVRIVLRMGFYATPVSTAPHAAPPAPAEAAPGSTR